MRRRRRADNLDAMPFRAIVIDKVARRAAKPESLHKSWNPATERQQQSFAKFAASLPAHRTEVVNELAAGYRDRVMRGSGFLAIWSDLPAEDETDWAHWMTREHAIERVRVEGFLACRIFRALGTTTNRYFILYDLERPDVVGGAEYLARLEAPTPWSQRIMPRLRNFARGAGRVIASAGIGQGGLMAAIRFDTQPEWEADALCRELASMDRVATARVMLTDLVQTSIQTREKSMRSKDSTFAGLLVIEGLDQMSMRNALWRLPSLAPQLNRRLIEELPLYAICFNLDRRLLPRRLSSSWSSDSTPGILPGA